MDQPHSAESKWPLASKHRILGAILLVSLAVIFIPVFLNGTPPAPRIQRTNIPPQPLEPTPLAVTEPSSATLEKMVAPPPSTPASKPVVVAPVKVSTAPPSSKSWIIQLASFFTEDNAQALQQRLQQAGFKAYITTATVDHNPVYRVYVGPLDERAHAQRLAGDIHQQFHVEGLIIEDKGKG